MSCAAARSTFSTLAAGTSISPSTRPPPLCATRITSNRSSLLDNRATSCTTCISSVNASVTVANVSSLIALSSDTSCKSPLVSDARTYAPSAAKNVPSSFSKCPRTTPRNILRLSTSIGSRASASLASLNTSVAASSMNIASTVSRIMVSNTAAAASILAFVSSASPSSSPPTARRDLRRPRATLAAAGPRPRAPNAPALARNAPARDATDAERDEHDDDIIVAHARAS
mmetsp:Transcript_6857/g.24959  ORF Transcript_6857/g.24959 Transcript_6857/m.24959 type:complete len:229 (+) Transcript_6857:2015-2701(+)